MNNSRDQARRWIEFLAIQEVIPFRSKLLEQFSVGEVTRCCDCGCNSFDLSVPEQSGLEPLTNPSTQGGAFFQALYKLNSDGEIGFLFFADARDQLAGIDITLGSSNHDGLPKDVLVGPLLYTNWMSSNNSLKSDAAKPRTLG